MGDTNAVKASADERLTAAETAVRREYRRTADEVEALRTFERRIRRIPAEHTPPNRGLTVGVETPPPTVTEGLRRVREAYESTVMSIPHYAKEYGDVYEESLCEEFSVDLAIALTEGTNFDRRCKQGVLAGVSDSQRRRKALLDALEVERTSLLKATETLLSVANETTDLAARHVDEAPFGTLDAYRARLLVLVRHCDDVVANRQETLFEHRNAWKHNAEAPIFAGYVYQNQDTIYPVMAVAADVAGYVRDVRRRVERAMAYCES